MNDHTVVIINDHPCLSAFQATFPNVDLAVAWIRLIFGSLSPEAWVDLHREIAPEAVEMVSQIAKVCFGVGA